MDFGTRCGLSTLCEFKPLSHERAKPKKQPPSSVVADRRQLAGLGVSCLGVPQLEPTTPKELQAAFVVLGLSLIHI